MVVAVLQCWLCSAVCMHLCGLRHLLSYMQSLCLALWQLAGVPTSRFSHLPCVCAPLFLSLSLKTSPVSLSLLQCRVCGRLVCDACSKNRTVVAGGQPQRTCNLCVSRINNALSPHPPSMPPTHPAVLPSSSSSFPSSLSSSSSSSSSAAANMLNSLNPDPRKPLTTNTGIAASKSTTVAVAVSSARSLVPPPSPSVPQQEQLSASLSEHVLSALQRQSDLRTSP